MVLLLTITQKKKKGNKPEDCQRQIINLYDANLKDKDDEKLTLFRSEKFKQTCLKYFKRYWTNKMISKNLEKAIIRFQTDRAIATMNFQLYSTKELDKIVKKVASTDSKLAVISVSSGTVFNSGIGGIMNKMGGLDTWKGIIVVHHSNIQEYESWIESEKKLTNAMKRLNSKCKVRYILLDSFNKQTELDV